MNYIYRSPNYYADISGGPDNRIEAESLQPKEHGGRDESLNQPQQ